MKTIIQNYASCLILLSFSPTFMGCSLIGLGFGALSDAQVEDYKFQNIPGVNYQDNDEDFQKRFAKLALVRKEIAVTRKNNEVIVGKNLTTATKDGISYLLMNNDNTELSIPLNDIICLQMERERSELQKTTLFVTMHNAVSRTGKFHSVVMEKGQVCLILDGGTGKQ